MLDVQHGLDEPMVLFLCNISISVFWWHCEMISLWPKMCREERSTWNVSFVSLFAYAARLLNICRVFHLYLPFPVFCFCGACRIKQQMVPNNRRRDKERWAKSCQVIWAVNIVLKKKREAETWTDFKSDLQLMISRKDQYRQTVMFKKAGDLRGVWSYERLLNYEGWIPRGDLNIRVHFLNDSF